MFYNFAEAMLSALERHAHPTQIVYRNEAISAAQLIRHVAQLAARFSGTTWGAMLYQF